MQGPGLCNHFQENCQCINMGSGFTCILRELRRRQHKQRWSQIITLNAIGVKMYKWHLPDTSVAPAGRDGHVLAHVLEVARGGELRTKDVVDGHEGGEGATSDPNSNEDPAVSTLPDWNLPEMVMWILVAVSSHLSGQPLLLPMLASDSLM